MTDAPTTTTTTTIIPAWIVNNDPMSQHIRCILGSEPGAAAQIEELPRTCLLARPITVPPNEYGNMQVPEHLKGHVFGCLVVDMGRVPREIVERIQQGTR